MGAGLDARSDVRRSQAATGDLLNLPRRWRLRESLLALALSAAGLALQASQGAVTGPPVSTRAHVETLASEPFEGRATGSRGATLAADYLVAQLKRLGAQPLPRRTDFRLPFEFTAGITDEGSALTLKDASGKTQRWTGAGTFQALSFSDSAQVSGPVVFAGYGLVVPESKAFSYDSYATIDAKNKIVVVLRYSPEDVEPEIRTLLARYSSLRYKALAARERGAKALIVLTGPRSPNAGTTAPMSFDSAAAGSGIVAASAGGAVGDAIFSHYAGGPTGAYAKDKTLDAVQRGLDTGNPHITGFDISGIELTLDVKLSRQKQTDYNVVGYLPPRPATGAAMAAVAQAFRPAKPYVVVGAHYDHLGLGTYGTSLARGKEVGTVHYGADDNASGVAAVLAAGAELAGGPRDRGIVLAFWSGEELGLLGSGEFVKSAPIRADQVAAYLNLDMVGRMRANTLTIQAAGTSAAWPRLLAEVNASTRFDLRLQDDPYLPTDVSSFNPAGVPSLSFFTGSHADYHRPSDAASSINYADLDRVARFVALLAKRIANLTDPPEYVKVTRKVDAAGGDRAAVRVYTGTIPDYASDVKGLKLGGVMEGGPAANAGLREGDVIVEFAGRAVTNIYDYMYALEAARIGQPVPVVFMRGGVRHQATLTPEARK